MVETTHSDGLNLLPPLYTNSSKGSFTCTIPQTQWYLSQTVLYQLWLERYKTKYEKKYTFNKDKLQCNTSTDCNETHHILITPLNDHCHTPKNCTPFLLLTKREEI